MLPFPTEPTLALHMMAPTEVHCIWEGPLTELPRSKKCSRKFAKKVWKNTQFGSGTKGEGKMRLTSEWVKVLAGALTLLALAAHALGG